MTAQTTLQDGLARIRLRFMDKLQDYLVDMEAFAANPTHTYSQSAEAALFALHKIAGTAAPLGFADLGIAAKETEDMLRADLSASRLAPSTLDACHAVCHASRDILHTSM